MSGGKLRFPPDESAVWVAGGVFASRPVEPAFGVLAAFRCTTLSKGASARGFAVRSGKERLRGVIALRDGADARAFGRASIRAVR